MQGVFFTHEIKVYDISSIPSLLGGEHPAKKNATCVPNSLSDITPQVNISYIQ